MYNETNWYRVTFLWHRSGHKNITSPLNKDWTHPNIKHSHKGKLYIHLRKMNKNKIIPFQPSDSSSGSCVANSSGCQSGTTLDGMPFQGRAHSHPHPLMLGHRRHTNSPQVHISGVQEETRVPRESPRSHGGKCKLLRDSGPCQESMIFSHQCYNETALNETLFEDLLYSLKILQAPLSEGLPSIGADHRGPRSWWLGRKLSQGLARPHADRGTADKRYPPTGLATAGSPVWRENCVTGELFGLGFDRGMAKGLFFLSLFHFFL